MRHKFKKKELLGVSIRYIIVIPICLVILFPYIWMVTTSLKPFAELFMFPPKWIPNPPRWLNYVELFERLPFETSMLNSFIVSSIVTICVIIVSCMCAYAFAKIRFPLSNLVFLLFMAAMMIPNEVTAVPLFVGMAKVDLVNTHFSIIVPHVFGGAGVFGIFLMRQTFITIPDEMLEAAKIDGCSHGRILWRIMLPMASSTIAALLIYTFFNAWSDYFLPVVFLKDFEKFTVPVALLLLSDETGMQWQQIMAATTIATVPQLLIFFIFQRKIVDSLALTGIK